MLRQVDFKDDFKPGPCLGSLNIWEFPKEMATLIYFEEIIWSYYIILYIYTIQYST
jgi:hypothetical protein